MPTLPYGDDDAIKKALQQMGIPAGKPENYFGIAVLLVVASVLCLAAIVGLNSAPGEKWLHTMVTGNKAFMVQAFFWSAIGSVLSGWKYYLDDKKSVQEERTKPDPHPLRAAYPNYQNVAEYAFNLVFAGILGIVGIAILIAGLGAFVTETTEWQMKQKMWLVVFTVIIGMYPKAFLGWLCTLRDQFFRSKGDDKADQLERSAAGQPANIAAELQALVKKDPKYKTAALEWIAALGLTGLPAGVDYSKDPEVFIQNPPGKDAAEKEKRLKDLLKHLKAVP